MWGHKFIIQGHNARPGRVIIRLCLKKLQNGNIWAGAIAQNSQGIRLPSQHPYWVQLTTAIFSLYLRSIILYQGTNTLIREDTPVLVRDGGHARNPTIWETEARGLSLNSRPVVGLQIPAHLRLQLNHFKTHTYHTHPSPPALMQ